MTDLERKEQNFIAYSIIELGYTWDEEANWPYVTEIIRREAEKGNGRAKKAYKDLLMKQKRIAEMGGENGG